MHLGYQLPSFLLLDDPTSCSAEAAPLVCRWFTRGVLALCEKTLGLEFCEYPGDRIPPPSLVGIETRVPRQIYSSCLPVSSDGSIHSRALCR